MSGKKPVVAVSMGCGVQCPFIGRPFEDDWGLPDPTGQPDEAFHSVIDEIEKHILALRQKLS